MNNSILAKRLKKLRDVRGFKQNYVADKIGVKSNTLSGYENGTRSPDPEMLVRLAKLYDVTTDYLLGHSDSTNATQDEELEELLNDPNTQLMFDNWKDMTKEERKEAIEMIKYIQFKNKRGD